MGVFDALRQSASAADIRILHVDFRDCNDENNESLVVYVRHAGRSFLFAGDAEWEDRDCTPAIQNMLARFTGSSRQTEGFLRSLLTLLNLDNDVPDHSTISRRKARLGKVASYERRTVKPVHLRIDSSGLSVHVDGFGVVLRHAPTSAVHDSEVVLRVGASESGTTKVWACR